MQFSGPTLRSLANFPHRVRAILLFTSTAKVCIRNIRPDKKLHNTWKFVLPHQKCYGPPKFLQARELDEFLFLWQHWRIRTYVCRVTGPTIPGGQRMYFLGISQYERQIEISAYFSWKVYESSEFFELSSSLITHSAEKLGVGISVPPPPPLPAFST